MPRARNIKPGFFANEELAELPFETRLLFIGLWTLADREGRMEVRPKKIKGALFPYDNDTDIDGGIVALGKRGFVTVYEVGGKLYLEIANWHKHQHPHWKEGPSMLPSWNNDVSNPRPAPGSPTADPGQARLIPDSGFLIPDSGYQKPSARGTRLPADWQPTTAEIDFAQNEGLSIREIQREADSFRDFWTSKPTNATKLDWQATWRNWIRKGASRGKGTSAVERVQRNNRRAAASRA